MIGLQKFTVQWAWLRSGFRSRPALKLLAKPSPPSFVVAIHALDLLLDILFDSSSNLRRQLRRRKNALNNLGRGTSALVSIKQSPGCGTFNAKGDRLSVDGIEASSH